jgi:hypothetical protein
VDVLQPSGGEGEAECWGGDHCGLDARIRCPRIWGNIAD